MKEFRIIKRHFMGLNRERLRRLQGTLRPKQRVFLDVLPLLFHVNHPMLPGFVSKETPAGVPDYTPTKRVLGEAGRIAKSFSFKRRALYHYPIHAIFLTGSSGTIAYSGQSDFDIWIYHTPELDSRQRAELRSKADAISIWASSLGLKTHFFIMDEESFKRQEHDQLSHESSGSTQHYLLLDEFYRTGLLVAGRYPVWWLVPPEQEHNYEDYVDNLLTKRFIPAHDVVDFGSFIALTPEEFVGASLWQIYKGIESPYKSVLKLLLMESYSSEYPAVDFLGLRFKKAVYAGEIDVNRLDPYVMMCNKVEEYLLNRGELGRLELVRRCLYFKVGEELSMPVRYRKKAWRRELMEELAQTWGWDQAHLFMLDSRSTWKIHRVLEERTSLVDELTRSYRLLSGFAREHAQLNSISRPDLNILGRKLYAAFERKAGKVEIVNPGISPNLVEKQLSMHQSRGRDNQEYWLLYRGKVTRNDTKRNSPLKRTRSLIELLAWCHFNYLLDHSTVISLFAGETDTSVREVRCILECLQRVFPHGAVAEAGLEDLSRPPEPVATAMFVNVGIDPFSRHAKNGRHVVSDRADALSYGGLFENLALSLDQAMVTSWQEVMTRRYSGVKGMLDCLCDFIRQLMSVKVRPPAMKVYCFSSLNSSTIARRIEQLFDDVTHAYYGKPHAHATRYVLQIEHGYHIIYMENNTPLHAQATTHEELIAYLSRPHIQFSPIVVDPFALSNTVLPLILESNTPDVVQLYYQVNGDIVRIYVLDENGSLFAQSLPYDNCESFLHHFNLFFQSIQRRQNILMQGVATDAKPITGTEYYRVLKDRKGQLRLSKHRPDELHANSQYLNVQVIVDSTSGGDANVTVYCDNREFTSMEFGSSLYEEVAHQILGQRQGKDSYPIYVTDVDLSHSPKVVNSSVPLQTVNYLNAKKDIEHKLSEAMYGTVVSVRHAAGSVT